MRFRCSEIEATQRAAAALSRSIGAPGLVLGLIGSLGAGKTAFVKGLAAGLGIDPAAVSSPTFVIANQYIAAQGRKLAHVDLYRLESASELDDVGFRDLLEPGAVVAVEWADRIPEALPCDRLELRIALPAPAAAAGASGAESRSFDASATRSGSQRVLEAWGKALRGTPGVEML